MADHTPEDWLAEHYPVPADEVPNDDLAMLDHAERKWSGLPEEVLKAYGLRKRGIALVCVTTQAICLVIDGYSCAFCTPRDGDCGDPCPGCPLSRVRGGIACDDVDDEADCTQSAPYFRWVSYGDPQPMLALLRAAREMVLAERAAMDAEENTDG